VLLISHNLADVRAVADRVTVLRLGTVAGTYRMGDVSQEEIVQAITGASDNVVARRRARTEAAAPPSEGRRDWNASDTQEGL
jgi:D-xylose transport system ATP-binding protein